MSGRAPRVAFAASPEALDLDAGWPLLRDAVAAAGIEPTVAVWEDATVDWSRFDAVVAIYTWGYVTRRERFLEWAAAAARATRMLNPEPVLRWNSEKSYLADLAAAGVPTVPTTTVPPGASWLAPGGEFVVKPTVASGAIEAARYTPQNAGAARAHVERLHGDGLTALVQPYLPAVDGEGETALVHFGGRFSHAVAKHGVLAPDAGPIFGLWERQVVAPRVPRDDQLALAERALRAVHDRLGPTAYARVDVVDGDDGRPLVMEVELIEPQLFLPLAPPGAADRFAAELRAYVPQNVR
jgi:glutathione synthase/RimK-type ligase-like ATP-grasp enzyme